MQTLTRKQQKENTRSSLIQAATEIFANKGIVETSTADVAKSTGVSHGTVFVHFPTRDDLILAVMDEFGARLSEEFSRGMTGSLKDILRAHIRTLTEYEDFYYRILSEMHALPTKVKSVVFMLNAAVSWKMHESAKPLMKSGKIKKMDR